MTSALNYFLKILEKKDYTIKELQLKGQKREYPGDEVQEAINKLIDYKYVDDDRLTQFLVEKYTTTRGQYWIQQKLQQRLISKELIQKYLIPKSLEDQDLSVLKAKIERKYKITNWKELDIKVKNKVLSFLSRNGFNNIYDILNSWINY